METMEQSLQELRLAEQAILQQSLKDKSERLKELESEITYLRRLLNEVMAVPRVQSQAPAKAPTPRPGGYLPRRWRA